MGGDEQEDEVVEKAEVVVEGEAVVEAVVAEAEAAVAVEDVR